MKCAICVLTIGIVVGLMAGPVSADTLLYLDEFDGASPLAPTWFNATDDGGDFAFTGAGTTVGVYSGLPNPGRAPYAYFDLPQSAVDAGYTLTVKGRCTVDTWGGGPFVGLTFGTTDYFGGNWFYSGWSGDNVMYANNTPAGGQTRLGGGGLAQMDTWYWLKAVVAAGGATADLYLSADGTNYTLRGDNIAVGAPGTKAGILTGWGSDITSEYDWVEVTVVPEPATMALLLVGLPLALRRRK